MKEAKEKEFYSEPFNEHAGQTCKGHGNNMTSGTYEEKEDRELLLKCINNYLE